MPSSGSTTQRRPVFPSRSTEPSSARIPSSRRCLSSTSATAASAARSASETRSVGPSFAAIPVGLRPQRSASSSPARWAASTAMSRMSRGTVAPSSMCSHTAHLSSKCVISGQIFTTRQRLVTAPSTTPHRRQAPAERAGAAVSARDPSRSAYDPRGPPLRRVQRRPVGRQPGRCRARRHRAGRRRRCSAVAAEVGYSETAFLLPARRRPVRRPLLQPARRGAVLRPRDDRHARWPTPSGTAPAAMLLDTRAGEVAGRRSPTAPAWRRRR